MERKVERKKTNTLWNFRSAFIFAQYFFFALELLVAWRQREKNCHFVFTPHLRTSTTTTVVFLREQRNILIWEKPKTMDERTNGVLEWEAGDEKNRIILHFYILNVKFGCCRSFDVERFSSFHPRVLHVCSFHSPHCVFPSISIRSFCRYFSSLLRFFFCFARWWVLFYFCHTHNLALFLSHFRSHIRNFMGRMCALLR